jgi:hypothetical protein
MAPPPPRSCSPLARPSVSITRAAERAASFRTRAADGDTGPARLGSGHGVDAASRGAVMTVGDPVLLPFEIALARILEAAQSPDATYDAGGVGATVRRSRPPIERAH